MMLHHHQKQSPLYRDDDGGGGGGSRGGGWGYHRQLSPCQTVGANMSVTMTGAKPSVAPVGPPARFELPAIAA